MMAGFTARLTVSLGISMSRAYNSRTTREVWRCLMEWLKSKAILVAVCSLGVTGLLGYGMMSARSSMEERITTLESNLRLAQEQGDEKVATISSDLDVVVK